MKLKAIRNLKGINALLDDQELGIEESGITVVYGENGAGKSGYFRVLKHACSARVVEPIHGDARSGASVRQTAVLEVLDVAAGGTIRELEWSLTTASPELRQIALFDEACGRQIVGTASEPEFLPLGLEVFQPFAVLLDETRAALHADIQALRDTRALGASLARLSGDHAVGRLLAAFPQGVTRVAIETLAVLTADETAELNSIATRIAELTAANPSPAIAKLQSLIRRTQLESQRLSDFKALLGQESMQGLLEKWQAWKSAQDAAELARQSQGTEYPLPGVGSPPWRTLFQAAREYSAQEAYPGQPFPATEPDALCVLCMQPLAPDAVERFRRFDAFIQDRSARMLGDAERAWNDGYASFDSARLNPTDPVLLSEIQEESTEIHDKLVAGAEELRAQHRRACQSCAAGTDPGQSPLQMDPLEALARFLAGLESRVVSLTAEKRDEESAALRRRQVELSARAALSQQMTPLLEALDRKAAADLAESRLQHLNTRSVTEKQKELATAAISGRYGAALEIELRELGVSKFRLGYKPSANKGQVFQQLHLPDSATGLKPEQVLSEGEHKIAALAAFLAEASLRPALATLVFDDPVSSLDHVWSERVAERLVGLAQDRQIIVFTHNLPFLLQLRDAAVRATPPVPVHARTIRRGNLRPGKVGIGLPWKASDVQERLPQLDRLIAEARRAYGEDPEGEEYQRRRDQFVSALRATWERLVEEDLFKGVVTRFQTNIATLRLKHVVVQDPDYEAVFRGMTWTSGQIDAHDHAAGGMGREVTPDDLAEQLHALNQYRTDLKARQQAATDARRSG